MNVDRSFKTGSLLIEILLALALFSISLITYLQIMVGNQISYTAAESERIELYTSKSKIEQSLLTATSTRTFSHDISPCASYHYFDELRVLKVNSDYFRKRGTDCDGRLLSREWPHIAIQKTITLPSENEYTAFDVLDSIAYIGTSSSSPQNVGLYIYSTISNSHSFVQTSKNITDLDAIKNYVYLALEGTSTQIMAIDLSNSSSPIIRNTASLPGVAGAYPGATSIFYYDSKLYIGTHRTAGNEFHIYDVSNPLELKWLGSIELNHNINSISVRDSYAYLGTSGNSKNIIILDISNPKQIKQISTLAFSGTEDTLSTYLIGNVLYIGRKKGLNNTRPEFIAVNISNPLAPYSIQSLFLKSDIKSLSIRDSYAFLATSDTANPLKIIDLTTFTATSTQATISSLLLDFEHFHLFSLTNNSLTILSP